MLLQTETIRGVTMQGFRDLSKIDNNLRIHFPH